VGIVAFALFAGRGLGADAGDARERFVQHVQPILRDNCYSCHGGTQKRGNVSLERFEAADASLRDPDLWARVLRNVRAGLMPPAKNPRLAAGELNQLETWIKKDGLGLDPNDPDPGRVTLRRLNRVEYRNTIRDLLGVDYDTTQEFPADDTGYGFDNIGDVLTVSPLLLEKYIHAAKAVVAAAVPTTTKIDREQSIFTAALGRSLQYSSGGTVAETFTVDKEGDYRLVVVVDLRGQFNFDAGKCAVRYKVDDQERLALEYTWYERKQFTYEFDGTWQPGTHTLAVELTPLTPEGKRTSVSLRVSAAKLVGPLGPGNQVHPKGYDRFFTREEPPAGAAERREYARELLARFASKAFRRPVDGRTVDRLVDVAERVYKQPRRTFEQGIAQAMAAVLASPRFLFRREEVAPTETGKRHALLDEYALATRLSYFLWSTMPDEELFQLAERGELRKDLAGQMKRMLHDGRSEALSQNFVGQWLQTRNVDFFPANPAAILKREGRRERIVLDRELRQAMRRETELLFDTIVREDRSVLELLDGDYTFLNERLARHYGIPGVTGSELRRVSLPKGSHRGGVLTHASVLMITSDATRTSPVKRGQFLLDNFLGTPSPPPPAGLEIPQLEEAEKAFEGRVPTLRETLAVHRQQTLCASCHARMDPLGLSLEHFNALGMWRETERGQPIDTTGQLISGESLQGIDDVKAILRNERRSDFYRCLTEKMLTYALGRGTDYYDVPAVDAIVARLEKEGGRVSALIAGIIESVPFQKRRHPD
jgi:hypothetical protein